MKLVVAIAHNEDAGRIVDGLLEREFRATRVQSSGGFLKKSNATVLVGVDESAVDDVISVIRANSKSRTHVVDPIPSTVEAGDIGSSTPLNVDVRGAIIFVVDVERVERL